MLPAIDASAQQFLNSVDRIQSRLNDAESQLASGLKVSKPSQAPDQVAPILQLQAAILRNQDIQQGVNQLKTEVDTGEQTLSSCVTLMDQALTLATEATGPQQTADTRASLAGQVQSILEQMVSASRTNLQGRYIFSGDQDQAPQYQLDLTATSDPVAAITGVDRLQAAASTRLAQGPNGSTFSTGLTAAQIFDASDASGNPTANNVFAALNRLRIALTDNDEAAIQDAIPALQTASTHLNRELAFYGGTQTRIASALTGTQNADLALNAQLSARQDADPTSAIVEMTQAQVQLQAAYQARAKMQQQSLFQLL